MFADCSRSESKWEMRGADWAKDDSTADAQQQDLMVGGMKREVRRLRRVVL